MESDHIYMWGYQSHFLIAAKIAVQSVCKALDPNFETNVFLVGLLIDETSDRPPVCLEPQDCGHFPSEFSEVIKKAVSFEEVDPRNGLRQTHHIARQQHEDNLRACALQQSLLHFLERRQDYPPKTFYCSRFAPVAGYLVSAVVELTRATDHHEYRLPRVHALAGLWTPGSLLEAAMDDVLRKISRALHVPEPDKAGYVEAPKGEVLRSAGDRLMDTPVWASQQTDGMYGLFSACNGISAQRYEGAESSGTLIISRRQHPNVRQTLALKQPVPLSKHRAARKLLETSATGTDLLSDGAVIYGLGTTHGNYDQGMADLFKVRFLKNHTWELLHDEHRMMIVRHGEPRMPLQEIDERKFRGDVSRLFPGARREDRLLELAKVACRQQHGTVLIVAADAAAEAARLEKQATLIHPTELTDELLKNVSAIDGAVLIDPSCVCHAIGAILDGLAISDGDSGRGARYNSCVRYLADKPARLALIVSEDGSVEWLPKLRPRLSRQKFAGVVSALDRKLSEDKLDRTLCIKLLSWLRDHAFYLSAELCVKANQLKAKFEQQCRETGASIVSYPDFSPDPDMNDSYFAETDD